MTCPHFTIKISTRHKGPGVVAQAAYQSGERLFDERSHRTKYYRKEHEIVYKEILLPAHAPSDYADRNTLWNAVESAEPNWNSQLARRFEIALPFELSTEMRVSLIRDYVRETFVAKGMIADIAVHDPDPPGHNPHAHVMLTMRPMDENGKWLPKSKKEYELDETGSRIRDENGRWKTYKVFTTDWDDRGNAEKWRHAWEVIQNEYLEKAGSPERIDMRSYKRQGIEKIPTVHMGPAVSAMEKRGIQTDIGNLNREILETNRLLASLRQMIRKLKSWINEIKEALREIEMEPEEIYVSDLLAQKFEERKHERITKWHNQNGIRKANLIDLKRFAGIIAYMEQEEIYTIPDLDDRMEKIKETHAFIRVEMKQTKRRLAKIDTIVSTAGRMRELSPVHEEYLGIRWKSSKQKYADAHHDELEEWKKCSRYLHKNLPDMKYDPKALKEERKGLLERQETLIRKLDPVNEEIRMIKDIRYLIREYLPELKPEKEPLSPEKKKQKKMSVKEQMEWAKKAADARNASRQDASPASSRNHEITR